MVALGCSLPGVYQSREALLDAAVLALGQAGLTVAAQSAWWASAAWPDPSAPGYLNGVLLVEPTSPPQAMLAGLHEIEARFGRVRAEANAPRTLDLDLIAHGRLVLEGAVTVPHPRAHQRLFVMGPLSQVAPGWRHPVVGETASALAAAATVGTDAAPV
ncbi:MAG: 2-amino-4-hydroxy-6-hydroxymethyldihydropteridine diphosphokinase [Caulobacter sp.]|nr:2-amino-4-hydroxy-6-hydroxymethyldihydropteridine diphosphokinase [Caulobacter sp.]